MQRVCPSCGESEELSGRPTEEGIRITCGKCGTDWLRDAAPATCATCGGADLQQRPQPVTAYSRGTQVSIVGWRTVALCVTCDADMLSRSLAGKPVPGSYVPAAKQRRDPDDTVSDRGSILPR
jgi:ribosomal protein S27AE